MYLVKSKLQIFITVILVLMISGCSWFSQTTTTESGEELSKSFKAVNTILNTSKEFYYFALESSSDAYKEGYLTEEQKEKIIKIGNNYKNLHNDATKALLEWYQAVNTDENVRSQREQAISYLFSMVEEGKTLADLLEKYIGEKTDIPNSMIPTFFNLVQALEPLIK